MTIEEKLKEYILTKYKSVREFVNIATDMPYSTVDGILKRGIANSTIGNVLKICKALDISADELGNGKIVPAEQVRKKQNDIDIDDQIKLASEKGVSLDGIILSASELQTIMDAAEVGIGIVRKRRNRQA